MEYDLYTTEDRRCSRVIQQDDGDSMSGSSYAGSDASHESGGFPVRPSKSREFEHQSQQTAGSEPERTDERHLGVRATNAGVSIIPADCGSQNPTSRGARGLSSGDDRRITIGQQEDRVPNLGTGEDGGRFTVNSVQVETLPSQSREELLGATSAASGLSEIEMEAGILFRNDGNEVVSKRGRYVEPRLGTEIQRDASISERAVGNREVGQGPDAESSSTNSLSIGSSFSRHQLQPPGHTGGSTVRSNREFRDIVLPRWQPDAEVTYCPICRTQFSFFVRKHHCRRCGRVVCNACSPHRITIPYQFIVQPPPAVAAPSAASISQSGANLNSSAAVVPSDFADRNGGMKVRLCNPCVPDPNPLPPQPLYNDGTSQVPALYINSGTRPYSLTEESMISNSGRARGLSAASGLRPDDRRPQQRSTSPYNRVTGIAPNNGYSSLYQNVQSGRHPGHMPRAEPLRVQGSSTSSAGRSSHSPSPARSSQSRGHASRHQSLSFIPGGSSSNPQPHYRSLLDIGNDQYPRTSTSSNRPLPPVPHVNEEDECPVCHRVLFSRSLPDLENRRAAHIMQCIDEQIALHSGNSSRPGAYTSRSQPSSTSNTPGRSSLPLELPTVQPPIPTPIANTPEARAAARERAHAAVVLGAASSASSTRRTGMFIYRASEKDCVDDAECTICLEEFEVGASMARLECFCRFHKKCIQDWFVDHPGRCPVHQHDGYGF